MARKKKARVEVVLPKPFSLEEHLDIPSEAQKFELSEDRTLANAKLVQSEQPQVTMTETVRNDDQLERFRDIYSKELAKRNICEWVDEAGKPCLQSFTSVEQAIAHLRFHWMMQNYDIKTARAAAQDIEDRLFPVGERSTTIHLSIEERQEIVKRHQKLLSEEN
jgi:hypothetical protein